jgi:hypothetical protein
MRARAASIGERQQGTGATVDGAAPLRTAPAPGAAFGLEHRERFQTLDTARMLTRLRAEVGPVDRVRQDLVLRLRRLIELGEYRPDDGAVAQNLLREVIGQIVSCSAEAGRRTTGRSR